MRAPEVGNTPYLFVYVAQPELIILGRNFLGGSSAFIPVKKKGQIKYVECSKSPLALMSMMRLSASLRCRKQAKILLSIQMGEKISLNKEERSCISDEKVEHLARKGEKVDFLRCVPLAQSSLGGHNCFRRNFVGAFMSSSPREFHATDTALETRLHSAPRKTGRQCGGCTRN